MSVPMRKDESDLEPEVLDGDLTTADLAQGKRPGVSEDRPRPVLAGRPAGEIAPSNVQNIPREVRGPSDRAASDATPLFPASELEQLRNRWSAVQTAFVDEPRTAVEQADGLVAAAMKRLAEVFAEERSRLEQQWDRGDNVSTEDLRIALQRYRSFFQRLLSI